MKLIRYISILLCSLFVHGVKSAWAVQTHGGAEGLVSHQIGHLLFVVGMIYLLIRIHSMNLKGRGWIEFRIFLWLVLLWNIITFSGHWLNEYISSGKFVEVNGSIAFFRIESFSDAIYFLSRLDHLTLVPAFFFLLIALRKWSTAQ